MTNTILKYGAIGGAIVGLLMLLAMTFNRGENMDFRLGEIIGYASMLLALSTVYLGIKAYRDSEQGGIISFAQAFKVGILITLIASAIYVLVWMIYAQTDAGRQLIDQLFEHMIEGAKEKGSSDADIQKLVDQKELYGNPFVKMGFTFLEIFPVGLIITLISALILRRGK